MPKVSPVSMPGTENNSGSSPVPPLNAVKKKVARRMVQRLPVNLKKKKIWSKLLSVDAGIYLGEWVYHDDEAATEVINGIRHLRELKREVKRKKRKAATQRNNVMLTLVKV